MTVLTGRQIAMFVLVTVNALQGGMLGRAGGKRFLQIAVTGAAVSIGNGLAVLDIGGLMNQMTGYAYRVGLAGAMGLMAFHAVGNITMLVVMTESAVKIAVSAGVVFYLADLGRMTGITGGHVVIAENNMQRLMGVLMTSQAVGQLEMGFAGMTHGALRNDFFLGSGGGMTAHMAVKASYFGSVLGAVSLIIMSNLGVTFDAVAVFQRWIGRPRGSAETHKPKGQ